jgi:glycosyltransferase involved in cell wall biosynthesis
MSLLNSHEIYELKEPGLFDPVWYLENYPDVSLSGIDPLEHYLGIGIHLGRYPDPGITNIKNRSIKTESIEKNSTPFLGIRESNGVEFDSDFYKKAYPDVAESGCNLENHYLNHGKAEGRISSLRVKYPNNFSKKEKTVFIFTHEASYTGAPILTWNLCKNFLMEYNVVIISYGSGPLLGEFSRLGAFEVGPFPYSMSDLVLKMLSETHRPDFALVNSIESRYALAALSEMRIPSVALLHEFTYYTRPLHAFHECIYNATSTVFSTSVTMKSLISRFPELSSCKLLIEPQGKCETPKNPLNNDLDKSKLNVQGKINDILLLSEYIVIGLGTIQYRKGVDLFIESARQIMEHNPGISISFLWFGSGYSPQDDLAYSCYIEEQIISSGLENKINILPTNKDLTKLYRTATLLLVPSRLDPLPNVAIDAMTHGLPLCCFNEVNGIAEHLIDAGLEIECVSAPFDINNMAKQATSIINNHELRKRISDTIKCYASEKFQFSKYVERLKSIAKFSGESFSQMEIDFGVILDSNEFRPDFYLREEPPIKNVNKQKETYIRQYIKSYHSRCGIRKPCPGFNPMLYPISTTPDGVEMNPFAEFLRDGKPRGPWNYPIGCEHKVSKKEMENIIEQNSIALHVHCFYEEMFPDIIAKINKNICKPDLLISVPDNNIKRFVENEISNYEGNVVSVDVCPNRGRDIGPLISQYSQILLENYSIFGHFHTKRSLDNKASAMIIHQWYEFLSANILSHESRNSIDNIVYSLIGDQKLGLVFPDDPNVFGWSDNYSVANTLASVMGIKIKDGYFNFPLGTMFWAKTEALRKLLSLPYDWNDYPLEPIPNDGTILHAIERLLPYIVEDAGYNYCCTNIPGVSR